VVTPIASVETGIEAEAEIVLIIEIGTEVEIETADHPDSVEIETTEETTEETTATPEEITMEEATNKSKNNWSH